MICEKSIRLILNTYIWHFQIYKHREKINSWIGRSSWCSFDRRSMAWRWPSFVSCVVDRCLSLLSNVSSSSDWRHSPDRSHWPTRTRWNVDSILSFRRLAVFHYSTNWCWYRLMVVVDYQSIRNPSKIDRWNSIQNSIQESWINPNNDAICYRWQKDDERESLNLQGGYRRR